MMLSHETIKKYIKEGKIVILPEFKEEDIRPVGIRLHLADELLIPVPGQTVDLSALGDVQFEKHTMSSDGYVLKSGDFVLGSTYESYQFPNNLVGNLDGRSTFARLGLSVHQTAQIVDGNYEYPGTTVYEIKNNGNFNLILKPRMAFAMLNFFELSEPVTDTSNFKYRKQNGVLAPEGDKV